MDLKIREELKLYRVIPRYIDALRDKNNGGDERVYKVSEGKEHRPFVGVIAVCNGQKYCIPLSTDKKKFHNMRDKIDFSKIVVNGEIVGAVEFSRMIPIEEGQLRDLDLSYHKHDTAKQIEKKHERQVALQWCIEHSEDVENKARVLYKTYISGEPFKRKHDCLNFPELEKICKEYNKIHIHQHAPKETVIASAKNPYLVEIYSGYLATSTKPATPKGKIILSTIIEEYSIKDARQMAEKISKGHYYDVSPITRQRNNDSKENKNVKKAEIDKEKHSKTPKKKKNIKNMIIQNSNRIDRNSHSVHKNQNLGLDPI